MIVFFTIALWDTVLFILQILGVLLSSVYAFFGGIGLYRVANRFLTSGNVKKGAAVLWFLVILIPTFILPLNSSSSGEFHFPLTLFDYSLAILITAKIMTFIYGFGYIIIVYFLGVTMSGMYESYKNEQLPIFLAVLYIFALALLTFTITTQMVVGAWYPEWIPLIFDISLLKIIWLPVSFFGVFYQWKTADRLVDDDSEVPTSHRIMIVIGIALIILPSIIVYADPFNYFAPYSITSGWFLQFVGALLILYPTWKFTIQYTHWLGRHVERVHRFWVTVVEGAIKSSFQLKQLETRMLAGGNDGEAASRNLSSYPRIKGAKITIRATEGNYGRVRRGITDESGMHCFKNAEYGRTEIYTECDGYESRTLIYNVQPIESGTNNICLFVVILNKVSA